MKKDSLLTILNLKIQHFNRIDLKRKSIPRNDLIFRKALAKSPVVRRSAEQEVRTVNKHRTSRYWLDDQVSLRKTKREMKENV